MKPFFKADQIIKKVAKPSKSSTKSFSCMDCGLDRKCKSPKIKPYGKFKKEIMIIGQNPGLEEDIQGISFVGPSGQLLKETLWLYGIDLDNDCVRTNACLCRAMDENGDNRELTDLEVKSCRPNVFKSLLEYKPKKIITLGKEALQSLVAHRTTDFGPIGKWVGWKIPDQEIKSFIYPNYHPSFVLHNRDKNRATELLFKKYIQEAIEDSREFPDYSNEDKKVEILISEEEIINYLKYVYENIRLLTFDYETTGKKPHREGHKIICMSIATNAVSAYAFPFLSDNNEFLKYVKLILTNFKIKKVGANNKYEHSWTRELLGYEVEGWLHDTMIAAHILDNRTGITGLKHQVYVRYGVLGYEDAIKPYFEAISENEEEEYGDNAFNKLPELYKKDPIKVLTYNGLDSLFEFQLYLDQRGGINNQYKEAYSLFHNGSLSFSEIESNGIKINKPYYSREVILLDRKINKVHNSIQKSNEVAKYKEKTKKEFNPDSDPQLKNLLYTVLNTPIKKRTKPTKSNDEGNPAVDHEVLVDLGTDFSKDIIEYRKLCGLKDKISGFLREEVEGFLHPNFHLNLVVSYRSGSNAINFQNIHKRDIEAQKLTRNGIISREGFLLVDCDYKGAEVCLAACNNKDPVLISYIKDKTKDMHRDMIMEILMIDKEQVTKMLRYFGKNGFVFPEFYGDWYVACAQSIWKSIQNECLKGGTPVLEHLKNNKIKTYNQFENHMKEVERVFWYEKFNVYREWKEKLWLDYQNKGYVELLSGFRCSGLMKKKEVCNYVNQGPAFHMLLWSTIEVIKKAREEKWNSKVIGQIHDQLILDVDPNELDYVVSVVRKTMCEDITKHWSWIIVPLEVEVEVSNVNGNWYEKKEYKIGGGNE